MEVWIKKFRLQIGVKCMALKSILPLTPQSLHNPPSSPCTCTCTCTCICMPVSQSSPVQSLACITQSRADYRSLGLDLGWPFYPTLPPNYKT